MENGKAPVRLSVMDGRKTVSARALEQALDEAAPLLAACQAGEEQFCGDLGWLRVDEWAGEGALADIEALAGRIRAMADVFVLIGVGGSNNAARAAIRALAPAGGVPVVYAGNTLSPHALSEVLRAVEGKRAVIDCVAKNFETLEPGASFRLLREALEQRCGREEAARRILCTGTPGSPLEALCRAEGYTFLPFPPDIGGRFTALSPVHLLPMAVAGVNIRALAAGALAAEAFLRAAGPRDNPALRYAVLRWLYGKAGYRAELLAAFEPRFAGLFQWWQQLFAESEGKEGKGLLPVTGEYSEQLHSLGQYVQDGPRLLFETFLDVAAPGPADSLPVPASRAADGFGYLDGRDFWDVNKASFTATRAAHSAVLPCLTLTVERLDEKAFGSLFYFFAFACYLSARLLGLNPFDQPGVEAYKALMFRTLGKPGAQ